MIINLSIPLIFSLRLFSLLTQWFCSLSQSNIYFILSYLLLSLKYEQRLIRHSFLATVLLTWKQINRIILTFTEDKVWSSDPFLRGKKKSEPQCLMTLNKLQEIHGPVSSLFHTRPLKSVIIRDILIIFKEPTASMSDSVRAGQAGNSVH